MNNENLPPEITSDNQESLQTLKRSITLAQGRFSLILVRCNYTILRDSFIKELKELKELCSQEKNTSRIKIQNLVIPQADQRLYETIKAELKEQKSSGLIITGLEAVKNIDGLLRSANQMRNQFSQSFRLPLILCVNDEVLQKLTKLAPDFYNWAAIKIRFELPPDELIQLLNQFTEKVFYEVLKAGASNFVPNSTILGFHYRSELDSATQDLQNRHYNLPPKLEASLEFIRGRDAYGENKIDFAIEHYNKSLEFWQHENYFQWQGITLFNLGLCYRRQADIHQLAEDKDRYIHRSCRHIKECIEIFENNLDTNLTAKFIGQLSQILRVIRNWDYLQEVAKKSMSLHRNMPIQLAQDYGYLAEVAIQRDKLIQAKYNLFSLAKIRLPHFILMMAKMFKDKFYITTKQKLVDGEKFARKALKILDDNPEKQQKDRGWYLFLLAQSQQGLGKFKDAIDSLEQARILDYNFDKKKDIEIYIAILELLRSLYFELGEYIKAFEIKIIQYSFEYQCKLRPFVGIVRLQPQQQFIGSESLTDPTKVNSEFTIAREIIASDRQKYIEELVKKIDTDRHNLIVINGSSGVGKSSLIEAGLVPVLTNKKIPDNWEIIEPIVVREYDQWESRLNQDMADVFKYDGIDLSAQAKESIVQRLKINTTNELLTVIIFDHIENFLLLKEGEYKLISFLGIIREWINNKEINIKIILSIKDEALTKLDPIHDGSDKNPDVIKDILSIQFRQPLEKFTPATAQSFLKEMTKTPSLQMEGDLIKRLVQDLARDSGRVSPMELQIVGWQLQTDRITSLENYHRLGKEKLIEMFLEGIIKDCGKTNERVARVLFLSLKDKNSETSANAITDLRKDLGKDANKLEVVLEILVKSGWVLEFNENNEKQYRLAHDYLEDLISRYISVNKKTRISLKQKIQQGLNQIVKKLLNFLHKPNQAVKISVFLLFVLVGLAVIFWQPTQNEFQQAYTEAIQQADTKAIQQAATKAMQEFKDGKELSALIIAIENGQKLKKQINPDEFIQKYPEVLYALQHITHNIKEKNEFFIGGREDIGSIDFSGDSNFLAFPGVKNEIKVWNIRENKVYTFHKHHSDVKSLDFSSNTSERNLLATGGGDSTVIIWTQQDNNINKLKDFSVEQGWVGSVSFSPDETLIAASADKSVWIFNLSKSNLNKSPKKYPYTDSIKSVVFSPTESLLAIAGGEGTVEIWQLSGEDIKGKNNPWHTSQKGIESLTFSPDGKSLATGGSDGTVKLWNLSGKEILQNPIKINDKPVKDVNFSFDGKFLAIAGSDGETQIRDLSGKQIKKFKGHSGAVGSVSFSPDGNFLSTADSGGTVRLWDWDLLEKQGFDSHENTIRIIDFIPGKEQQRFATVGGEGSVKIWDTTGQEITLLKDSGVENLIFSPDGKYIAALSKHGTVEIWDYSSDQPRKMPEFKVKEIKSLSFSPDSTLLVTADQNWVQMWTLSTLKESGERMSHGGATNLFFSSKGDRIASVKKSNSESNSVYLWDRDGKKIKPPWTKSDKVYTVAFSHDGKRIATVGEDSTIKIWNMSGEEQKKLLDTVQIPSGEIEKLYFSKDDQHIAAMGKDGTAYLFDLSANSKNLSENRIDFSTQVLLFSPTSKLVATTEPNGKVIIWNMKKKEIADFPSELGKITAISFSRDGHKIVAAGDGGQIQVWNIENLDELLKRGCQWLDDYLKTNSNISPDLCANNK